ncbi:MAG: ATP-binding protein [Pseudomonadota bacterium]
MEADWTTSAKGAEREGDFAPEGQDVRSDASCAISGKSGTPGDPEHLSPLSNPWRLSGLTDALKSLTALLPIKANGFDHRVIGFALAAGLGYFLLASLGLRLWAIHPTLASIWVPNAVIVALLLLARLRNEVPLLIAVGAAAFAAHSGAGDAVSKAGIFALAHVVDVTVVTALIRRTSSNQADSNPLLTNLSPILQCGGLVGPTSLGLVAAFAVAPDWGTLTFWLLADSIGMILIVPAILVAAEAWRGQDPTDRSRLIRRGLLMLGGLIWAYFVFAQNLYPLLFLVPPVTLLIAFRAGPLGAALFVPALAVVAMLMTFTGVGPIALLAGDGQIQSHLLQSFFATNFMTGLPIAAILYGRARMTSELARNRSELTLLTESITDAVLWIDRERQCTYASPSVAQVLGRSPDEMVGHSITRRSHPESEGRITALLDRLFLGDSDKERLTYRRYLDDAEGKPVYIEADCAVVTDPVTRERNGVVVSARDVTDRVQLETQLTRARSNAENAAHAKSEFLANMSHEIRTPMNGVLGFAELMLQGDLDKDSRYHTEMIVQSGRSMMLLLNDILDLSKIEAGQIVIDREPVDLFETITECAALHRTAAEHKGLRLHFHAPCAPEPACQIECRRCDAKSARPWVMTDGLRLRQIVLNLISNAVKFTENGGVDIDFEQSSSEFTITVRDSGIGISSSRLEAIFAPFTQGESDITRRFGGTGLGLTISRQLAELLGGTLSVESKAGVGSTFRLTLPAHYIDPPSDAPVSDTAIEPTALPQSARVLLVEDHDVNRLLGIEMLERCGQSVEVAHDGNEAIAMVIDAVMRQRPYDLILMDIQMPGCDGYAATRAIRADGIGPDRIPIIALTANAFPEDIAAARDAGMQAHLAKPLVFSDLARALQRWLPTRIIEDDVEAEPLTQARQRDVLEPSARALDVSKAKGAVLEPRILETGAFDAGIVDTSRPAHATVRLGQPMSERPSSAPQSLSAGLLGRWNERRGEAIEAVRDALESGELVDDHTSGETHEKLARLVHKLAGTAASFGEPELGDRAAALENAIRMRLSSRVREALAFELLSLADDPKDAAPISSD